MTLVPVSYWLGGIVKQSFLSKYPIEVIHNGIDLNVFVYEDSYKIRTKYKIGDGHYIIGVASVWDYRKGFEDFLKLKQQISKDVKIVLVGLNKQQLRESKSLGIIGIPHTESMNELAALYSGALLYCNLTYEDNYPTTNLEAMACGTPVLTYDTGGSVEAVSPDTGWVVKKGDIEKIVSIIEYLKERNQEEKEKQRKSCTHRANTKFDKNIAFQHYLDLYEKLVY